MLATILAVALPGGVSAETLKQALTGAYKANPKLDAERARLRATDEEVPRAMSGYRPQINGSADVGIQNNQTKPSSPTNGETHPKGFNVNAVQPLFRGFRTMNGVSVAEATVRAGRETLRTQEADGTAGSGDGVHGRRSRPVAGAPAREQRAGAQPRAQGDAGPLQASAK